MQLLDLSDHLPGLPRLPGLKKWYARDKIQYYSNWEEASQVRNVHLVTCSPSSQFSQITLCGLLQVPHNSHIHVDKRMVDKVHNVQVFALQSHPCMGACLLVCWSQQIPVAVRVVKHAADDIGQLVVCHMSVFGVCPQHGQHATELSQSLLD